MSKPARTAQPKPGTADTPRIAVVGWGLITPLGDGAWPTFRSLLAGRTLADRADALPPDTAPVDLARALGCVVSVQHNRADPAVCLAERAVREAATMAGLQPEGLPLWLGTSKGAVARLSEHLGKGLPLNDASAQCVAMGPHAYLADQLRRRLHTVNQGHCVAACSSGLIALDAARRALLQRGPHRGRPGPSSAYALVASADAAITPAFVASYQRLGVLGTVTADAYRQRPLDAHRSGFMLSEMGAAVVLKRIEPGLPLPCGAVELVGTASATEPYDMVRSPSVTPGLQGLWRLVTAGRRVDLIHPHAPGTREHDPAELGVLLQTPSPSGPAPAPPPDVYAVKGAFGHGLGASGLASLVVAAMCLKAGRRPPMPWLADPMRLADGKPIGVSAAAQPCDPSGVHAVLAAGFGGHLAAAVLQGPPRGTTRAGASS